MKIIISQVVTKTLDLGNTLFNNAEDKKNFLKDLENQGWKIEKVVGQKCCYCKKNKVIEGLMVCKNCYTSTTAA